MGFGRLLTWQGFWRRGKRQNNPISLDRLRCGLVREKVVCHLILTGERKPRVGHQEIEPLIMRFARAASRQQTICRVTSIALGIVHDTPPRPANLSGSFE